MQGGICSSKPLQSTDLMRMEPKGQRIFPLKSSISIWDVKGNLDRQRPLGRILALIQSCRALPPISVGLWFPLESASWLENERNTKNKANTEIKACLQIDIHLTELQQFSSKFIAHQSEEQTVNLTGLRQTQHKQIKRKFLPFPALSGHPCSVHQRALVFLPTLPICWCSKVLKRSCCYCPWIFNAARKRLQEEEYLVAFTPYDQSHFMSLVWYY